MVGIAMSAKNKSKGFSLIEVLVSLLVLMVVTGAVFYAMAYYQRNYGSSRLRAELHESMRGAVELISQEVGQAGLLDSTTRTTAAITAMDMMDQPVVLNSVDSIFGGEELVVDTGSTQETVKVATVVASTRTITATFNQNHAANVLVRGYGVFPQGVLPSTSNELRIFGDINGDGTIAYVTYTCDTSAGTLSRSMTAVKPDTTSANGSEVLISNLTPNPGNTACFQYIPKTLGPYTFVTSVAVTLSAQSSKVDPQTKLPVKMTKSFLNLAPRNVLMGLNVALSGSEVGLQQTPTNVISLP
jgi:type II secretory pathway pseudopilin PulG